MKAKGDIAVCSGHIFLDMSVDIRRKVTSFPMEKEGCCGLSCVSVGAPKMHPSQGQSESLSPREPRGVRCWLLLSSCSAVRADSGCCLSQPFWVEDERLISDLLCFVPCCGLVFVLLLFVYQGLLLLFLPENENQTWNLQRSKNLKVTIVPSIKGQFWLWGMVERFLC